MVMSEGIQLISETIRNLIVRRLAGLPRLVGNEARRRTKEIWSELARYDSHERAYPLLQALKGQPPNVFWPVFLENWSSCDGIAKWRPHYLKLLTDMAARAPAYKFQSQSDREFYDSLPDLVTVYRGCGASRVRSLSWTTEKSTAEEFARGHRVILVIAQF
jgi:hypothetical protein